MKNLGNGKSLEDFKYIAGINQTGFRKKKKLPVVQCEQQMKQGQVGKVSWNMFHPPRVVIMKMENSEPKKTWSEE